MSSLPSNLLYTKDHEWALLDNGIVTIGITDHAQSELGDIVFVDLPRIGDQARAGDSLGTIEAVKTVADIYSPVSGEIMETNTSLADSASAMNQDPYGQGWIARIRISDVQELNSLLSPEDYSQHIS